MSGSRPDIETFQVRCDITSYDFRPLSRDDVYSLLAYTRGLEAENLALRERVAGHHAIVNETAKAAAIDAGAREEETWRERVAELEAAVRQRDERIGELELRIRDPQGWARRVLARSGTEIEDQDTTEATG